MKNGSNSFDKIDITSFEDEIKLLNKKRLKIAKIASITALIIGSATIILAIISYLITLEKGAPLVISIVGMSIFFILYHFITNPYIKSFKYDLMSRIIKQIGLKFEPDNGITKKDIYDSEIFKHSIYKFQTEDKVSGEINGIPLEFSEVRCKYQKFGADGKAQSVTFFQGIFFKAQFNKNLKQKTIIVPDTNEKINLLAKNLGITNNNFFINTIKKFANIFKKINNKHNNINNVKLENILFEDMFEVYSENEIESRYILTPDMMEKIIEFKLKHNLLIYFSFIEDNIYIAIEFDKKLFEAPLEQDVQIVVEEYIVILNFLFSIVEKLKLDNNIYKENKNGK
jgi:hypothetical protein